MRNQNESPLLRLPKEVRMIIYSYAIGGRTFAVLPLTNPIRFEIREVSEAGHLSEEQYEREALRLTCRFLRWDTEGIVPAENTLVLYNTYQHPLQDRHLPHPLVQIPKMAIVDIFVRARVSLPHLLRAPHKRLRTLQRLEHVECVQIRVAFFTGNRRIPARRSVLDFAVARVREAFLVGRHGRLVDVIPATPAERLRV